jgi:hypothetical protein
MRMTSKYQVYKGDDDYYLSMQTGKMKISFGSVCSHMKSAYCYEFCYQYLAVIYAEGPVLCYDFQKKRRMQATTKKNPVIFSFSEILELEGLLRSVEFAYT